MAEWRTELPQDEVEYLLGGRAEDYTDVSIEVREAKPNGAVLNEARLPAIAEVERAWWSYHDEPFNSDDYRMTELTLYAVVRFEDGRWGAVDAWNDYTGWGCRDGVSWYVGPHDDVLRWGLSDEARKALDYVLDDGGAVAAESGSPNPAVSMSEEN